MLSITDGDTFRALIGNQNVPIRMADYDAPERDQPYGREATEELTSLLAGGIVQLEHRGSGGFGRTAARVFVGDVDVNFEMVRRGAGWFDPEYAQDEELYSWKTPRGTPRSDCGPSCRRSELSLGCGVDYRRK